MMARVRRPVACALAFVLAACRGGCRRSVAEEPIEASPPATSADDPTLVVHDCVGLGAAPPACPASLAPWDDLVQASERLTEIPARHTPPPDEFWARLDEALGRASSARLEDMRANERVAVQNAAVFLAISAKGTKDALATRARALVKRLAFPADTRPASTEPDAGLDDWLGPRADWTERTSAASPLMHESVHRLTRVFRLVRTPVLRANFSQLVAIDDRGEPFVTSVVGSVEIRRGVRREAHACVLLPDAARLRCGTGGGLAPVADLGALPQSHFLGGGKKGMLRCIMCHGATNQGADLSIGTFDVDAGAAHEELATRRARVLASLRRALRSAE